MNRAARRRKAAGERETVDPEVSGAVRQELSEMWHAADAARRQRAVKGDEMANMPLVAVIDLDARKAALPGELREAAKAAEENDLYAVFDALGRALRSLALTLSGSVVQLQVAKHEGADKP
jgi:hypothetical protein